MDPISNIKSWKNGTQNGTPKIAPLNSWPCPETIMGGPKSFPLGGLVQEAGTSFFDDTITVLMFFSSVFGPPASSIFEGPLDSLYHILGKLLIFQGPKMGPILEPNV